MQTVSHIFIATLKTFDQPAYRVAQRAKVNPNTLSRLINGIEPLRPGDERIIAVARILGLRPEEAFTEAQMDDTAQ